MQMKKSDDEIQRDVLKELRWDTRVEPSDVGVTVRQGIVTLTGVIASYAKKVAAAEAAHRVAGVLDVANDLVVGPSAADGPTDTEIAEAVRRALEWDVLVPDDRIQSTVASGFVTLTGRVDLVSEREDAERAVRNLAGVRLVDNQIVVHRDEVSPGAIRAAIHDALERHAERHADRIRIEVDGGRVTLHGNVHSWREREAIVGAATGTRGVSTVVDRLRSV